MLTRITFPEVERETDKQPKKCPRCGYTSFYHHKRWQRKVLDPQIKEVEVRQYKCKRCGKIDAFYPKGVSRSTQTQRTKLISVILYALGLSYDKVSLFMEALGLRIVKATIWENVQKAGKEILQKFKCSQEAKQEIKIVGADETVYKVKGEKTTVGFLTNQEGEVIGIEILSSREGKEFVKWLKGYAEKHGAEVLVSDDLDSYGVATESLGLNQQICLAHVRKNVSRRLKKIKGYDKEKQEVKKAVKELDEASKEKLKKINQKYIGASFPRKGETQSPEYALRSLTLDLLEKWEKLTLFKKSKEVPQTNNRTEQAIGLSGKIRYKQMRGYKSRSSLILTIFLIAALQGTLAGVSFEQLLV